MNLGKQCPRIREIGSLYPSSGLKKALCDYYASIIRLCKHITLSIQKPGAFFYKPLPDFVVPLMQALTCVVYMQLSRALLVSFKAEFGPLEGEIAQLSQTVRDEASLASKQAQKLENELQAEERSKNNKTRELWIKSHYHTKKENKTWRLDTIRRRLEKRKMEALDSFSSYDYHRTYSQIRKDCVPGTSLWICEDPEFQAWMTGSLKTLRFTGRCKYGIIPSTLTLLIYEKSVGSGKSVIRFSQ